MLSSGGSQAFMCRQKTDDRITTSLRHIQRPRLCNHFAFAKGLAFLPVPDPVLAF